MQGQLEQSLVRTGPMEVQQKMIPQSFRAVGAGAKDLADAIVKATQEQADFKLLYGLDLSIEEKIEKICKDVYRADGIEILRESLDWRFSA